MSDDSRMNASRYRQARDAREHGEDPPAEDARRAPSTRAERAVYVETLIDQAIRAGEFDDLPGAGKPLSGLGGRHDPDWWIRRKIEREQLGGLGPPALTLRTEDAGLDAQLDALHREGEVRELLGDFNRRVVDARRQLLGGPPVVTSTRDVDAEVRAWRERRVRRAEEAAARRQTEEEGRRASARPGFASWLAQARERRRDRQRPPTLEA